MASKLKNLRITSVSVVDEGANPRAGIKFTKRKEPINAPAADPAKPETEDLYKRFTKWLEGQGMTEEEIRKQATSFAQQIAAKSVDQIDSEIWDVVYALRQSLSSILYDDGLDAVGKTGAMNTSVTQFASAIGGYITKWCSGSSAKVDKIEEGETNLALMCGDKDRLGKMIKSKTPTQKKGEPEDMIKIDKSKMSPDELKAYEEIVKKYAVDDGTPDPAPAADPTPVPEDVNKGKDPAKNDPEPVESAIVKALREQIEATNAQMQKMKDDALTEKMSLVAKKYCDPLGKKEDELVATLKKMKGAGDEIYDSYIASLDQQLEIQNQSGVFTEIGKSTSGSAEGDVQKQWIAKAKELQTKKPTLSLAQAMDEVALSDDELRSKIDQ